MTTIKIRNNLGTTIKTDKYGNMEITGNFTYQISAGQVHEDAPTNSMSAQAIAGGREGDQPPMKSKNSKAVITSLLRRKMKD